MAATGNEKKDAMDWGHDAPKKDTTPLDDFIKFITDPNVKPAILPGQMKNVLIYWDRGDLGRGDEQKMKNMGIDSNACFAHVLDVQQWFHKRYPKDGKPNENYGLGPAAERINIDKVTQKNLDVRKTEAERASLSGAMIHNAAGDSELTLRIFVAIVLARIQELNNMDGGKRSLRDDFCFIGLNFEGDTTEIGFSSVLSMFINESAGEKALNIGNKHAIIWEKFDEHPRQDAQADRMKIDDVESRTYPRWNFRGGPNTTQRREFCTGLFLSFKPDHHQSLMISVDSEVIYSANMAWWIKRQVPGTPESSFGAPVPTHPRRHLVPVTLCPHANHEYKRRPRRADGSMILSNVQTRMQKKHEYSM
ncbi:hypothetical protein KCU62_g1614, partial [Aureobasidium sp. EXF-3399]